MKILVTGGAGFIGSHTVRALLQKKCKVICIDNFNNYYSPKIKKNNINDFFTNKFFKLYISDITNFSQLKAIFNKEKPEIVCHLAARAGVRASIENPFIYEKVNVSGTLNILELSRIFKVKNIIIASSSSVYGNNKKVPFSEDDRVDNPVSPYAATKRSAELLTYNYSYLYNLNCIVLRFFTVYGPSGRPDMAPYIFVDRIYNSKFIKKFGDGTTKRDYTYISDIVDGILKAINKRIGFSIINLGNNKPVELNYFINLIEKLLNKKAKIIQAPKPPEDVIITYADITKAQGILNYNPKISIEQGMKEFIDWYLFKKSKRI